MGLSAWKKEKTVSVLEGVSHKVSDSLRRMCGIQARSKSEHAYLQSRVGEDTV